jgi:hypothetical protein
MRDPGEDDRLLLQLTQLKKLTYLNYLPPDYCHSNLKRRGSSPGGTEVRKLGKSAKGCRGRKLGQAEVWRSSASCELAELRLF